MKTKFGIVAIMAVLVVGLAPSLSRAHCEIPCGIYDDETRVKLLAEHVMTIEKSMRRINQLAADTTIDYNQLVRWIDNKEDHANKFQEIVTQYFMTQRVKPVDPTDTAKYNAYVAQTTVLHEMLVVAMKCKQTTDLAHPAKLTELIEKFRGLYFKEHKH